MSMQKNENQKKSSLLKLGIILAVLVVACVVMAGAVSADDIGNNDSSDSTVTVSTEKELKNCMADMTVDTIKLGATISMSGALDVKRKVTLDLNGCELRFRHKWHIYVAPEGDLTINDSSNPSTGKIMGGKSSGSGGCIYVGHNANLTLNKGTIRDGNAKDHGGGIYLDTGSTFTMNGGTITNNATLKYDGGGVYVNGATFVMTGGTLTNNKTSEDGVVTSGSGGAVYVNNNGTFEMGNGCIISENHAKSSGGGVFIENGTFIMKGGTIWKNRCEFHDGGGVYMSGGTFKMSGESTIDSNYSEEHGGGVYISGGTFEMSGDSSISWNKSCNGDGGGVYLKGSTFTMNGGRINVNKATGGHSDIVSYGGGVYVDHQSVFTMNGGVIIQNTANKYGGGVCIDNKSQFYLTGGTISGNLAEGGNGCGVFARDNDSKIFVSGSAKITGNTKDGKESNLYLNKSKEMLTLQNDFSGEIRVTYPSPELGSQFGTASSAGIQGAEHFLSDDGNLRGKIDENNNLVWTNGLEISIIAGAGGKVDKKMINGIPNGAKYLINGNQLSVKVNDTIFSTVTATSDGKYTFKGWFIGEKEIENDEFVKDKSLITAKFSASTMTIKVMKGDGGNVDKSEVSDIPEGAKYRISGNKLLIVSSDGKTSNTVTATANNGYVFKNWTIGGTVIVDNQGINNNETVTANFIKKTLSVSIKSDGNGMVSTDKLTDIPDGSEYTFSDKLLHVGSSEVIAIPNSGYSFKNWTVNGEDIVAGRIVKNNDQIIAHFVETPIETFSVYAISEDPAKGTVGPHIVRNVKKDTVIQGEVTSNTLTINETKITATAYDGCEFDKWIDFPAGGIITEDILLKASFKLKPTLKVTVSKDGDGTVSTEGEISDIPEGSAYVVSGNLIKIGSRSIFSQPDIGNSFKKWTVNGYDITEGQKVVSGDTIVAHFVEIPTETFSVYAISEDPAKGTVNPQLIPNVPKDTVIQGEETSSTLTINGTKITATAHDGYQFNEWEGVPADKKIVSDTLLKAKWTETLVNIPVIVSPSGSGIVSTNEFKNIPVGSVYTVYDNLLIVGVQSVYAKPESGNSFEKWTVNGHDITEGQKVVSGDTIAANFVETPIEKFSVYVISEDPAKGTVEPQIIENVEKDTEIFEDSSTHILTIKGRTVTPKANEGYQFNGWEGIPADKKIVSDTLLKATWVKDERYAYVEWKDEDGTLLDWDIVKEGTVPEYKGVTPEKEASRHEEYWFAGWEPEPEAVVAGQTYEYKAEYYGPTAKIELKYTTGGEEIYFDTENTRSLYSVKLDDKLQQEIGLIYVAKDDNVDNPDGNVDDIFRIGASYDGSLFTYPYGAEITYLITAKDMEEHSKWKANPENFVLCHYVENEDGTDGEWIELETSYKIIDNGEKYLFTANTDGFSPFAMTFNEVEPVPPTPTSTSSKSSSSASFNGVKDGNEFIFENAVVVKKATLPGATSTRITNNGSGDGWYKFTLSSDGFTGNGTLYFQVPLDVIEIKGYTVNDVSLFGCTTKYLSTEGQYAKYSASIEKDGTYTIGFEKDAAAKTVETQPVTETKKEDTTPVTTTRDDSSSTTQKTTETVKTTATTEKTTTESKQTATKSPFPVLGILAGIGAAAVLIKRRQ